MIAGQRAAACVGHKPYPDPDPDPDPDPNPNPNPSQANELWRAAGASCRCHTYRVIPTGARTGYIEALENAIPILGADFAYSRRLHN